MTLYLQSKNNNNTQTNKNAWTKCFVFTLVRLAHEELDCMVTGFISKFSSLCTTEQ